MLPTGLRTETVHRKNSIIYELSMSMSVKNIPINLPTDKEQKKIYLLYSVSSSIGKFNITPIRKLYVIPSMFLFVRR
jgi:hypothetical protein